MPVQMIELEEVGIMVVSDTALEKIVAIGGRYTNTYGCGVAESVGEGPSCQGY